MPFGSLSYIYAKFKQACSKMCYVLKKYGKAHDIYNPKSWFIKEKINKKGS